MKLDSFGYEPTEDEINEMMDNHLREQKAKLMYKLQYATLFDPFRKEEVSGAEFRKRYNLRLAKKAYQDPKHHLHGDDYQEAKAIYKGEQAKALKPVKKKKTNQYIQVPYALLDNDKILKANATKLTFYFVLKRYVWKHPSKADTLGLYNKYYKGKRLLVASKPQSDFMKMFGIKKEETIKRWTDNLRREGAIKLNRIKVGKGRQCVYILGEVDAGGNECYYYGG